ncbi:hypothetical protein RCO48_34205 [Peribacillus frigoritolerans]|nr:hypothetical protein [Peribacillus frigoritolerans]
MPADLLESELFGYEGGHLPEPIKKENQGCLSWQRVVS